MAESKVASCIREVFTLSYFILSCNMGHTIANCRVLELCFMYLKDEGFWVEIASRYEHCQVPFDSTSNSVECFFISNIV